MAPLPKLDLDIFLIKDLLHLGKREEALARIKELVDSGRAGEKTIELAEYLKTAGKGRQPFGVKHLWFEIGQFNDEMRDQGMSYADRMAALKLRYRVDDESKLKTWIGKYEATMDEIRVINSENL